MRNWVTWTMVIMMLLTISCAGREPVLVTKERPTDEQMDCGVLKGEIEECTKVIEEKYFAGKRKTQDTIAAGVAGYVLFPPLLLAMDLKKADYKEMGAYQERRNHLIGLAQEKECDWCETVETDEELMARCAAQWGIIQAEEERKRNEKNAAMR